MVLLGHLLRIAQKVQRNYCMAMAEEGLTCFCSHMRINRCRAFADRKNDMRRFVDLIHMAHICILVRVACVVDGRATFVESLENPAGRSLAVKAHHALQLTLAAMNFAHVSHMNVWRSSPYLSFTTAT